LFHCLVLLYFAFEVCFASFFFASFSSLSPSDRQDDASARVFSRAELHELAQLRSHYFDSLAESALEVRHELLEAQERVRMLVRLADVYDDDEEAVQCTASVWWWRR
jgi:hypothetical protein